MILNPVSLIKSRAQAQKVAKVATIYKNKSCTCSTEGIINAIKCISCQFICIGQTGDRMKKRLGQHKSDIKKRPGKNDMPIHFKTCKYSTDGVMNYYPYLRETRRKSLYRYLVNLSLNSSLSLENLYC